MRNVLIVVSLVLTVGLVAYAQQAPTPDTEELRAKVVNLRVEVEFLELEHGVASTHLQAVLREMRTVEALKASEFTMSKLLAEYLRDIRDTTKWNVDVDNVERYLDQEQKKVEPYLNQMKKDFEIQSRELNSKRLELAEAEEKLRRTR